MKILVVDDKQESLQRVERVLCELVEEEVQYVLCASANHAIDAIEKHRPDVLFLDWEFEVYPGAETGRGVAQWLIRYWRSPIAVATHTQRDEDEAREFFQGCGNVTHFVGSITGISISRVSEFVDYCQNKFKTVP